MFLAIAACGVYDMCFVGTRALFMTTDADIFQAIEKNVLLRRRLEEEAADELQASWNHGSKRASNEFTRNREIQDMMDKRINDSNTSWVGSSTTALDSNASGPSLLCMSTSTLGKAAENNMREIELEERHKRA